MIAWATAGALLAAGIALGASAPDPALWNGARAMDDIARQLSFGVRALDTDGHQKTIDFIAAEAAKTSATVEIQHWVDASGKTTHRLTNVIVRFDPSNPRRILVGSHYDSIVRAYNDAEHPDAPMPGANNSASGVALLLETARVLNAAATPPGVGVDFVFFDGEEGPVSLGAGDPLWKPLGSPYLAKHIDELYPKGRPIGAVLFDMVCYKNLRLYPEVASQASARKQSAEFWNLGGQIAPAIFARDARGPIFDDQTALAAIGIPSFLVIGFDYDPWFNTTQDTLDKCSPRSLEAVGRTLVRYLYLAGGQGG
jgi:hypothetical protein